MEHFNSGEKGTMNHTHRKKIQGYQREDKEKENKQTIEKPLSANFQTKRNIQGS